MKQELIGTNEVNSNASEHIAFILAHKKSTEQKEDENKRNIHDQM